MQGLRFSLYQNYANMQIHQLKPKSRNHRNKTVGRGGKRGKTSGRGTKGQRARAGHRIRPEIRDLIKKLPKRRGRGKSSMKSLAPWVTFLNVRDIEKHFSAGDKINRTTLTEKRLVRKNEGKGIVKILGGGNLTKKFSFSGIILSKPAREKIEKAGGTIQT